jgi:cyclophilin family peptidyl-prolyl cis-trans isomerase
MAANPDAIRVVYRNFGVGHLKSDIAIQAAEAAALQGKYWEMHDVLFDEANVNTLEGQDVSVDQFKAWAGEQAVILGMDLTKFLADMDSQAMVDKAKADTDAAVAAGLTGTPSVFYLFDNQLYFTPSDLSMPLNDPVQSLGLLNQLIQLWAFHQSEFKACPPVTVDAAKTYTATLKTTKGDIVIELYPKEAPLTVNSFVFLAQQGWFTNNPIFRVIEGFVAQMGDPTGTGGGTPGYRFGDEIVSTLNFDVAGMVGMANSGAGTNGSQFFITLAPATSLNGRYTVFGKVTSGLEVLAALTRVDPTQANQPLSDTLLSVTITIK